MESLLPLAGFQLPFQRSISSLYNNTKKSTDFIKEPVQNEENPDIKALHRKLRIQNDRLVSWGIEWSDPAQSAEIDESLSKAGLSEVVAGVMSTIKDILAEAEPLWLSSKRLVDSNRSSSDHKTPLVQWDKGRFEDLVHDLTASIDTLYDLSRTRASSAVRRPSKTSYKTGLPTDEIKPFESTRMQTPQQIDPSTLTHVRPARPSCEPSSSRSVVFMSKTAYSQLLQTTIRQPWAPLLLEHATFDSIYSMTGIMPPMARFEKISAALQQDSRGIPGTWTGLPRLVGYFEDLENSRLGLIYRFPPSFNAITIEKMTQNPISHLSTLDDLLVRPDAEPPLEAKFRLAHNLANTVFDLHARGITHGNICNANITFCDCTKAKPEATGETDVRKPLITSFDLFGEALSPTNAMIYRHPLDPRTTPTSPLANTIDERILELYSLAMVLLSVGLWTGLETLTPLGSGGIPPPLLRQLAVRCGNLYAKAVELCCGGVDEVLAGRDGGDALLSTVQFKVSRYLEACCILDGMSSLEERLSQELSAPETNTARPQPTKTESSISGKEVKPTSSKGDGKLHAVPTKEKVDPVTDKELEDTPDATVKAETKVRLYPQVPLPPEAVEKWNKILMPQINQALRHFYRKNPESVEISLESVGPSPQKTQPTVLVVCTSVGKVRAILKKRLGELFDGSTGFALKVCRGHVLRSRRLSQSVLRSMARRSHGKGAQTKAFSNEESAEVEPVNPEYQARPGNGASIGAWIGDKHLPPVSFGGLVMIDDKPYGMTVHHMLDDPDSDIAQEDTLRSSDIPGRDWFAEEEDAEEDVDDEYDAYELSDTESEPYSETDITSDYEDDDEEDDEYNEPGDIPGIEPGCGEGYIVTQPALDDVEEGFYPCEETKAEDHLDSFSLGKVYASSGIRRKATDGLVHEVDWALFQFSQDRLPNANRIPEAQGTASTSQPHFYKKLDQPALLPKTVASLSDLPGMEVQCMARTSGLQTGQILPALTSVKIYGRTSPSHTYQVASIPSADDRRNGGTPLTPMGIPGDSGAWVVDRQQGQLCGHVLAWSQRKRVAYICPMDVLLKDIAHTLEASEVRLPGGEAVVSLAGLAKEDRVRQAGEASDKDLEDLVEDEEDTVPTFASASQRQSPQSASSRSGAKSTSPIMLDTSSQLRGLARRMEDMSIGGRGIDVTG
ncbi:hypothetical protein S7711_03708 [Stachybotrys chartarum IBT 7711]|uniref:Protein kinase domain-containing protein n=1 Tax=Stachybotrys chartarum (strain CBS 109288 / IBT 7711) TaxID=1280523 RepID=A0A084B7M0_STACB|nr:hypothetical protein S7711_03708 [Stachybotrys chartarum IBT 7711]